MHQLSIFDTEPKVGFRHRWHVYDNGINSYTVIPGHHHVTVMGRFPVDGKLQADNHRKFTYSDYKQWISDNNYTECP